MGRVYNSVFQLAEDVDKLEELVRLIEGRGINLRRFKDVDVDGYRKLIGFISRIERGIGELILSHLSERDMERLKRFAADVAGIKAQT